jgi:hypothetical protein
MNLNGTSPAVRPLYLMNPDELRDLPEPEWLVEPFIPVGALVVLFGATGGGRSRAS